MARSRQPEPLDVLVEHVWAQVEGQVAPEDLQAFVAVHGRWLRQVVGALAELHRLQGEIAQIEEGARVRARHARHAYASRRSADIRWICPSKIAKWQVAELDRIEAETLARLMAEREGRIGTLRRKVERVRGALRAGLDG